MLAQWKPLNGRILLLVEWKPLKRRILMLFKDSKPLLLEPRCCLGWWPVWAQRVLPRIFCWEKGLGHPAGPGATVTPSFNFESALKKFMRCKFCNYLWGARCGVSRESGGGREGLGLGGSGGYRRSITWGVFQGPGWELQHSRVGTSRSVEGDDRP